VTSERSPSARAVILGLVQARPEDPALSEYQRPPLLGNLSTNVIPEGEDPGNLEATSRGASPFGIAPCVMLA